jgi:hypothetical protein
VTDIMAGRFSRRHGGGDSRGAQGPPESLLVCVVPSILVRFISTDVVDKKRPVMSRYLGLGALAWRVATLTHLLQPEEDQTVWYIPLELKVVDKDGKVKIDHKAILDSRETIIPLPDVANTTYKLNAETAGVYRTLYPTDRWEKLGQVAKDPNGAFSLSDRCVAPCDHYTELQAQRCISVWA